MLAHLPPDRRDALVGVDAGELPTQHKTLRERQVLVEHRSDGPDWVSIATPVLDPSDSPIAAIEVVIPAERATGIDVKNNIKVC